MPIPAGPRRAAPPRRKTPKAPEPTTSPAEPIPGAEPATEPTTEQAVDVQAPVPVSAEPAAPIIEDTVHKSPEPVEGQRPVRDTQAAKEAGELSGDHEMEAVAPIPVPVSQ